MKSTEPSKPTAGPWERYGWLMAVVWMAFLFYPGVALVASDATGALRLLGWIGFVGFAGSYLFGFMFGMREGWRNPTRAVFVLFGAAVLSVAATIPAIGWNCTSFLPFLMAYASYGIGRIWHWVVLAIGVAVVAFEVLLSLVIGFETPWVLFGIVMMMAVVNTVNTWLIDRSVTSEQLRVELATSEERESVARDVHDVIGHSLTAVKLKADLASRLIDRDPQAAKKELDDIVRLAAEAIAGVRGTVTGLRGGGLAEQLRVSSAVLESAGIDIEIIGNVDALSPAQSIPAGWILREATTNILRHAQAHRVWITIDPGTIIVEDDGVGLQTHSGNGMQGMAERATAAGAIFRAGLREANEARSTGTRVSVTW